MIILTLLGAHFPGQISLVVALELEAILKSGSAQAPQPPPRDENS